MQQNCSSWGQTAAASYQRLPAPVMKLKRAGLQLQHQQQQMSTPPPQQQSPPCRLLRLLQHCQQKQQSLQQQLTFLQQQQAALMMAVLLIRLILSLQTQHHPQLASHPVTGPKLWLMPILQLMMHHHLQLTQQ
jgi:uncharacterized protein YlxW (UPF0749 family)